MINIEGPLGKKSLNIDLEIFDLNITEGKEVSIKPQMSASLLLGPGEENKVLEFYKKNPEAANAIRAPIFEEKVIDYIKQENKKNP